MNCYVCASSGNRELAVGVCRACGVGLCLAHHRESVEHPGPGGTFLSCIHQGSWVESRPKIGPAGTKGVAVGTKRLSVVR
jgi:hypothetical protein